MNSLFKCCGFWNRFVGLWNREGRGILICVGESSPACAVNEFEFPAAEEYEPAATRSDSASTASSKTDMGAWVGILWNTLKSSFA